MIEPTKTRPRQSVCSVRCPEPTDSGRMAELAGQLGYTCTAEQVRARLTEIQDANEYMIYVAEIADSLIAGWIGVYVFRSVEMDKFAEISGLVVTEEHRSHGIGKSLLHAAEEWARNHACAMISVHSNVTRERAHGFYQRNGYVWYKTQQLFRKCL